LTKQIINIIIPNYCASTFFDRPPTLNNPPNVLVVNHIYYSCQSFHGSARTMHKGMIFVQLL